MRTRNHTNVPPHSRGFSAIEMILVVGLSGILLVGLTAMIDMPQQMAAREESANPSVSSADRALSALDRDIRFATDVRTPTADRLELDQRDGATITWEFQSGSSRLLRTANGRTATILEELDAAAFAIEHESSIQRVEEAKPVTTNAVTVASFDNFVLKAGYTLGAAVRGLTAVTETVSLRDIDTMNLSGIYLKPGSLGGDLGVPTSVRMRLQRVGAGDVVVQVFEADPVTRKPIRLGRVAEGRIYARQIPVTVGEVSIPLAMERRLDPLKSYFVIIRSTSGVAAKIETRLLSLATAIEPNAHSFLVTSDGGSNWSALGATFDSGQTRFGFDAVRVAVDTAAPGDADGLQVGYNAVEVPVAVLVKLALRTPAGVEPVRAAFPLQNMLALVRR